MFDNYLDFVRAHRGSVIEDAAGATIVSNAPNAASWTPYTDIPKSLPATFDVVRLVSWSGDVWPSLLSSMGFVPAEAMSFMDVPDHAPIPGGTGGAINVAAVQDNEGALRFADVQSAGFLRKADATFAFWDAHVREVARANCKEPAQTFLLAETEGILGGVAVTVVSPSVTALYAVATRPEFHRRGFGSTLLGYVVRDARARGFRVACSHSAARMPRDFTSGWGS